MGIHGWSVCTLKRIAEALTHPSGFWHEHTTQVHLVFMGHFIPAVVQSTPVEADATAGLALLQTPHFDNCTPIDKTVCTLKTLLNHIPLYFDTNTFHRCYILPQLWYLISNIQSPSLQPIHGAWSPHLFPGHQTSHSPSTFDHAQLYLGNPSIISVYPALITNITGFSIVPPFVFPEL